MRQLARSDVAWVLQRLPRVTRDAMETHGVNLVLAGGFIRAVIANERVNDVDLFCKDKAYADTTVRESLAGSKHVYETKNALTFRTRPYPTQVITRWVFNSPEDCVLSFDYTICQAAIWYQRGAKLWTSLCTENFYSDLAAKRLVYTSPHRIEEAGGSLLRMLKYYQRGYRAPLDSVAKIVARLTSGLDFSGMVVDPSEDWQAQIILGLLREVDPLTPFNEAIDADNRAFETNDLGVIVDGDAPVESDSMAQAPAS